MKYSWLKNFDVGMDDIKLKYFFLKFDWVNEDVYITIDYYNIIYNFINEIKDS